MSRMRVSFFVLAALTLGIGVGVTVTSLWLRPHRVVVHKVAALQDRVQQQRDELAQLRLDAKRDMQPLTGKLGELEARSLRMDAVLNRLVKSQGAFATEFDFAHPAIAAASTAAASAEPTLPQALDVRLTTLDSHLQAQQNSLGLLQGILADNVSYLKLTPRGKPVAHGQISSPYGYRTDPFTGQKKFHSGIDIAASEGARISAVADGIVTFAGAQAGYGNMVEVAHGGGYKTRYAHAQTVHVDAGDLVHAGDKLATAGMTGRATGPHVHFEVWHNGKVENPFSYLKAKGG